MTVYGQHCPVAKAMGLLDERWTVLVIRELITGSRHFNDLRRGLPEMSATLLSKRLQHLQDAAIVDKLGEGQRTSYRLTVAGEQLAPIVEQLAIWGVRWLEELEDADLHPQLLMRDVRRWAPIAEWPEQITVLAICLLDAHPGTTRWWLRSADGAIELHAAAPTEPVDATISVTMRVLADLWRGRRLWAGALGTAATVTGGADAVGRVPEWLGLAPYSETTPRDAADPAAIAA